MTGKRTHDAAAAALLTMASLMIGLLEGRRLLPIDLASTLPFLFACAPLAAIVFFYRKIRPNENVSAMALTLLQMLLFSALGCILQYLLAREGGAPWDARLTAWDRMLGLDWLAYVRWVDAHAAVAGLLAFGYGAMIPTAIVLIVALGLAGKLDEMRVFVLAGMLCGAVTILLSPLFPSGSSYVLLGLKPGEFLHVNVQPGYDQAAHFTALRAGTFITIRLPELQGIIAFPSYHAGLATVSLWGFWTSGLRWIRWPGVTVALSTVISAPVGGGHYFVDVFAGVLLAIASIAAATRLACWPGVGLPLKASPFRRSREAFAR